MIYSSYNAEIDSNTGSDKTHLKVFHPENTSFTKEEIKSFYLEDTIIVDGTLKKENSVVFLHI